MLFLFYKHFYFLELISFSCIKTDITWSTAYPLKSTFLPLCLFNRAHCLLYFFFLLFYLSFVYGVLSRIDFGLSMGSHCGHLYTTIHHKDWAEDLISLVLLIAWHKGKQIWVLAGNILRYLGHDQRRRPRFQDHIKNDGADKGSRRAAKPPGPWVLLVLGKKGSPRGGEGKRDCAWP